MKRYTLLIAMITGAVGYPYISLLSPLTPFLIFTMLLLSYSKLSPKEVKIKPIHVCLLLIQLVGSLLVYALLARFDTTVAQGALICILAPTATAASAIVGLLGGSIAFVAGYLLLCNLAVAIGAPLIFSFVGEYNDWDFWTSFFFICKKVVPLLIVPLFLAWGIRLLLPMVHKKLSAKHGIAFYLWAIGLTIVTATTVKFLSQQDSSNFYTEFYLGLVSLVICIFQFVLGRKIGKHYGDAASCGQSLGQKNTILAIWMAQTYLHPLSCIAPASYVLWQNLINSYQLWKKK